MDEAVREYIEFTIKLKLDEMQRGLQATNERIAEFDRKAKQNLNNTGKAFDDLDKKGQTLKSSMSTSLRSMEDALGSIAAKSGIAFSAIAAGAALAGKAFGDLQAQSNTLQAVSGASAKEMDALNAKALALGESSKYTATQVASTNVELAKLGFTSSEIQDAIDGVVAAAGASGTSLVNAGELIAGTVRGFSLAAKDANFVADVLAQAANKSALGFEDMQLSMKYIAPVASASNQKLTDMVGIMALLSNNMIKGESAGTALRSIMVSLQAPSGEAAGYIKKLGLEVADADGKIKPLPKIMGELQDKMKGLSQKTGNKVMAEIFGSEALPAISVLMKTSKEDLAALIEQMEKADGASGKMTKIMNQGLNYELDQLKAKAETAAIKFGKELEPALTGIIKSLQQLVDWFGNLPEPVKNSILQVGLLVGTIALLTGGFALAGKAAIGFVGSIGRVAAAALEAIPALNAYNAAASGGGAVAVPALGAALLTGGGIGLAANLYINSLAADQDSKTKEKDSEIENGVAKANAAMARINALRRKGGDDLGKLNASELKSMILDSQTAKNYFGQQIKDLSATNDEIARLEKQFNSERGEGKFNASLRSKIDNLQAGLGQKAADIRAAKEQLDRYVGVYDEAQKKYDKVTKEGPAKVDPKVDPNKENLFNQDDAAKRAADKAASDRVDALIQKHERATKALKTQLEQQATANGGVSKEVATVNDALASKLINNAQTLEKVYKGCFGQVYKAYKATFGDGGKFDLMKGGKNSGDWVMAAADSANRLAQDTKRFHEVDINSKNYQEVMKNLKSTSIIVYERGHNGFDSNYGHIEVYDPKTQMAYYGGAKGNHKRNMTANMADHARVFEMNTSGTGFTGDMKKNTQEQQILNQLTAAYNQQLQEAIALRNQMPAGSDAWKKADEHVFKLQQAMKDNGLDVAKLQAELQKAQAEAARQWALEQLDIDASMAEAKAQLTADSLDDIEASHLRTLTNIRKAELDRLAKEGTTEEQRLKLKKLYDTQREAAEKQHQEALKKYGEARTRNITDMLAKGAQAEAQMLSEGLNKQLRLQELATNQQVREIERQMDEAKTLYGKDSDEYALLELEKTQTTKDAADKRLEIIHQYYSKLNLDQLQSDRQKIESDTQSDLQGVIDPEKIDQIRLNSISKLLANEQKVTEELDRQLNHQMDLADQNGQLYEQVDGILALDKQVEGSIQNQKKLELEKQQIIFQGLQREAQERRELTQNTIAGLNAMVSSYSKMAGLSEAIGGNLAGWLSQVDGLLSRLKTAEGIPLTLSDMFKSGGSDNLNAALTSSFGVQSGGLSAAIPAVGSAIGVASQMGLTYPQIMTQFFGDPSQVPAMLQQHKDQMIQMDQDIAKDRLRLAIEAEKAKGNQTFDLERQQVLQNAEFEKQKLIQTRERMEAKKGLLFMHNAEETVALRQFDEQSARQRIEIDKAMQNQLLEIERNRLQKVSQLNLDVAQEIAEARLNAEGLSAGLSAGRTDDVEAERNRLQLQAWDTWSKRMKPIREVRNNTDPGDTAALKRLQEAEDAVNEERRLTFLDIEHKLSMRNIGEQARLRQIESKAEEETIKSTYKGLDREIELIRLAARERKAAIEDKLKDPTLDPRERAALSNERRGLSESKRKQINQASQKAGDASAYSLLDLDADKAKATKTQMDDVVSEYKRKLKDIEIAEREAKENLTGPELQTALARYAQQRINIEQDTAKRVKEIWASEYSEKLNMQKTLIQEQLALDSRALQGQISDIEKVMRPIQNEVKKLQMDLEASQRARDSAKRPFQAGDGKRNTQWTADMSAFNADPYAWAGVQAIANTDTHNGLNTVSGATQREGLLKEAALMELEATNMVTDERITEADFKSRMQKAQLIRAKAAEMELATEGLKRERKLELEKEWAEAYAAWQQYATEAIDARYDVEDQRIQDNINLKNQQLQQQQTQIDNLQLQLSDLGEAAEKKIRPIDDELMRVQKTLRDQVTQWKDIKAGIEAARKEAEAYRAAMGAAGGVTGTGSTSIDRSSSSSSAYPVDGGDGYYYETSSDFYKAQKLGLESGGFIPNSSRFSSDGFGPVYLNSKEAVVPFDKWPEILRPFMRQGAPSVVFNPQITISGNHIVGEFDMYNTAYRAAEDLWRNNNDLFATNAGRLF